MKTKQMNAKYLDHDQRWSGRRIARKVIFYLIINLLALMMLFPFVWMVLTSLKTSDQIHVLPPTLLPNPVTWEKYQYAFSRLNFAQYTFNSVWLAVVQIVGTILSASMTAFGITKLPYKGSKFVFSLMLATLMLPSQVTIIPVYIMWVKLGLVPSYWPLILPAFLGGGATNVYLFVQTYRSLPNAFFEAALIEGAHPVRIFTSVYFPLSKSVMAAVAVFSFIGSWNNTLGPLLYLQKDSQRTLVLGLLQLQGHPEFKDFGLQMAGATITIIPTIIVFIFFQRYFVEGIASAGVKG